VLPRADLADHLALDTEVCAGFAVFEGDPSRDLFHWLPGDSDYTTIETKAISRVRLRRIVHAEARVVAQVRKIAAVAIPGSPANCNALSRMRIAFHFGL